MVATKHQYYDTGDDTADYGSNTRWLGQSFLVSVGYTISSVKLLLYRNGTPGTITVSIREMNDTTKWPYAPDLCVGTTNGNTLTTDSGGEWREIFFTVPLALDTKYYAIIVRSAAGTFYWRYDSDESGGGYADGLFFRNTNSGDDGDWGFHPTWNFMFECWGGTSPPVTIAGYIWIEGTELHYIDENEDECSFEGDATSNTGTAGYIWVEGDYFHYIDENGDERRFLGAAGAASGQEPGHIWVDGTDFHYIDQSGVERFYDGS